MLEAVIVALVTGVLGWGIWKTRDWKPTRAPSTSQTDLESTKFLTELLRDTGKQSVRLDRVESELENIRSEWKNYRSSVDSIVRRGIRHKVLDAQTEETPLPEEEVERAPVSRSELLRLGLRGNNRA